MTHSFRTSFWASLLASWLVLAAASQPNIVFILTDDLGYGDLGVYYQNSRNFAVNRNLPAFATPHIDSLATQGLRMNRHYCGSPVCAPSRASFLTGMHQGHANVRDNEFDKALEDNHTVATVLKEAGYATAVIGKWGLQGGVGFPGHPDQRGFDFFFGMLAHLDGHYHYPETTNRPVYNGRTDIRTQLDKCYSTDLFTARAKKWIVDQVAASPTQPFFLYLAYTAPHARLDIPTQAYPAGGGLAGGLQWTGVNNAMINTASGTENAWLHPDYASATWDHDNNPGTAEQAWPNAAKRHATMIRRLDDAVGDLRQLLADLNIADNTLVIFTSDNGPHHEAGAGGTITQDPRFFRSYGPLDGTKRDLWEAGWRVPLLAVWPGVIPAGRVSTTPSQFQDWLPTFAHIAGVRPPFRSDGVSLLNDLTGTAPLPQSLIYAEYTAASYLNTPNYNDFDPGHRNALRGHMQAVFVNGYKGLRYNVTGANDVFRVYDVVNDPRETTNLAGQAGAPSQADFLAAAVRNRRPGVDWTRAYDNEAIPGLGQDAPLGLRVRMFASNESWVARFDPATALRHRDIAALTLNGLDLQGVGALSFTGHIQVTQEGDYSFSLRADTAAVLRIHGMLVLDADRGYAPGTLVSSAPLRLKAGLHPFQLNTRQGTATPLLELRWSGPGLPDQPVPPLSHAEAWRLKYFNQRENSGLAADHQNPDSDDWTNLLERAFGGDPGEIDTFPAPEPVGVHGESGLFLGLRYRRIDGGNSNPDGSYEAEGLRYWLQTSETLPGSPVWSPVQFLETLPGLPLAEEGLESVVSRIPLDSSTPTLLFLRLGIEAIP
jgi:arylsulfatase A-like enzyme